MTQEELMIGDWVYYKGKEQMPCRVISIGGNSIKFDNGTPQDWMSDVKNFTPIPLTAEILKKNGFGYVENDVNPYDNEVLSRFYLGEDGYCENMDVLIGTYNRGVFWFSSPKCSLNGIRYVHELQRVLRLCDIEKEIIV